LKCKNKAIGNDLIKGLGINRDVKKNHQQEITGIISQCKSMRQNDL